MTRIKGTVRFWELGRGKKNGEFDVDCQSFEEFEDRLLREFGKHLISRDIDFHNGTISAGFHSVGKYSFRPFESYMQFSGDD